MEWFYLALISVFASALSNIFQRLLMKKDSSDPIVFSIFFQLFLVIFSFCFALYKGFVFPPLEKYWLFFLIGGVLYASAVILNFQAVKRTEISNVVIIGTLSSIVTIVFAVLLLNESFGLIKVFGTLLIIGSIINLYWNNKLKFDQGFYYAVGSSIFFGLAVVNDAFILKGYSAISYTPVMSFIPMIMMVLIYPRKLILIKKIITKEMFRNLFLLGIFYSTAAISFYLAIEKGANASQISPINRASIIVTVMLAAAFLNEKDQLFKKILSAIVVTIGVLLLV